MPFCTCEKQINDHMDIYHLVTSLRDRHVVPYACRDMQSMQRYAEYADTYATCAYADRYAYAGTQMDMKGVIIASSAVRIIVSYIQYIVRCMIVHVYIQSYLLHLNIAKTTKRWQRPMGHLF